MNLTELLSSIANAIRTKTGSTDVINAQDFPTEISNIKIIGSATEVATGTTSCSYTATKKCLLLGWGVSGGQINTGSVTSVTCNGTSIFTSSQKILVFENTVNEWYSTPCVSLYLCESGDTMTVSHSPYGYEYFTKIIEISLN